MYIIQNYMLQIYMYLYTQYSNLIYLLHYRYNLKKSPFTPKNLNIVRSFNILIFRQGKSNNTNSFKILTSVNFYSL